jgi:hypothetical protein
MAGGQAKAGAIVFKDGETAGFGLFFGWGDIALGREAAGEIVVFAQKMAMLGRCIGLSADGLDDVLAIENADQAVDSRGFGQEIGLVALNEAPGDHYAAAISGFLELDGLVDFPHGFFLGGGEESAGVDDDGVGLGWVAGDGQAVGGEEAEHALAID